MCTEIEYIDFDMFAFSNCWITLVEDFSARKGLEKNDTSTGKRINEVKARSDSCIFQKAGIKIFEYIAIIIKY